jgi:hypothetical protein
MHMATSGGESTDVLLKVCDLQCDSYRGTFNEETERHKWAGIPYMHIGESCEAATLGVGPKLLV